MLYVSDTAAAYNDAARELKVEADRYGSGRIGTHAWSKAFDTCFGSKYCDTMFPRYLALLRSRTAAQAAAVAPSVVGVQRVVFGPALPVVVHRSETQGLGGALKDVYEIVKDFIEGEADRIRPPSATDMADALATGKELSLPYTPPSESDLIAVGVACARAIVDTAARFDGTLLLPPPALVQTSSDHGSTVAMVDSIVFYVQVLERLAVWLMHRTGVRV